MLSERIALNQRYQQVAEDDSIGNALRRSTPETEDSGYDSEDQSVYDLSLRSQRTRYIIGCHKECTEDKTTCTDLTERIGQVESAKQECKYKYGSNVNQRDNRADNFANYHVNRTNQQGNYRYLTDSSRDTSDYQGCQIHCLTGS